MDVVIKTNRTNQYIILVKLHVSSSTLPHTAGILNSYTNTSYTVCILTVFLLSLTVYKTHTISSFNPHNNLCGVIINPEMRILKL